MKFCKIDIKTASAIVCIGLIFRLSLYSFSTFGQTAQEVFGKNRIQYKTISWNFLSTNSIDLYYYKGGEKLAKTASELAEIEFKRVSDLFGFTPYNKIKIFLYLSTNDRLMSNVGLGQNSTLTGGKTNFTKSITEVAYEGSIQNIKKQISAGIAQILIRDMLFGGSLKDAVQNSYLLTLPDWFIGGAIRYASEGDGPEMEDLIREITSRKKIRQPANYLGKESYLIGQSIWFYISEKYGKSSVGNILNLTRIIRNEENAIVGTLGMPYETFLRDWKNFYLTRPTQNKFFLTAPFSGNRIGHNYLNKNYKQIQISADGEYLVYSQDWKGKFQVVTHNIKTNKSHVVFRGGSKAIHQNSEGEFPIICLLPENKILLAYPEKGIWKGMIMSMKGFNRKRLKTFESFHEIYSLQLSQDGKSLAISGSLDNYSDIFLVNMENGRMRRLTNDWYDDLDPFFNSNGDTVLFSSTRLPTDTLEIEKPLPDSKRKLWIYAQSVASTQSKPHLFLQSEGNLYKGRLLKENKIICLADESGTSNIAIFEMKPGFSKSRYLTSSKFNIKDFAFNEDQKVLSFSVRIRMKPSLFLDLSFEPSLFNSKIEPEAFPVGDSSTLQYKQPFAFLMDSNRIDIRNYIFEDDKNYSSGKSTIPGNSRTKKERIKLKKEPKPQIIEIKAPLPYSPIVTANHLTTGLVVNPIPSWGLGALVDFSMHDLFENHHINGGMTYFFSDVEMRNNWSFLEYQYLKKRIDFKLRAERKAIQNSSDIQFVRQRDILQSICATASYPISNAFRFEISPYFQTTKRITFDRNNPQLGGSDFNVFYYGLAGELVFDNTSPTGLNMITGTRIKVRSQYQVANQYSEKQFGEFFFDMRTYQPIHKEITLAIRSTFGSFFGNAPKTYSLGGMDNWLFRSYNVSNEKDDPLRGLNQNSQANFSDEAQSDWLFNRFSTNLRGFQYNAAYGSSYMLFNAEIRIPIVQYFYKGPINSNFWRNLQLTGFTDIGTAWTGVGPFNKNNSLNTKQINDGYFSIKVKTYENPFLTGFGAGARTMFLGYYSKFDVAWGKQNGIIGGPRYYFTLGYDF